MEIIKIVKFYQTDLQLPIIASIIEGLDGALAISDYDIDNGGT
jgi:hypothetical protein